MPSIRHAWDCRVSARSGAVKAAIYVMLDLKGLLLLDCLPSSLLAASAGKLKQLDSTFSRNGRLSLTAALEPPRVSGVGPVRAWRILKGAQDYDDCFQNAPICHRFRFLS